MCIVRINSYKIINRVSYKLFNLKSEIKLLVTPKEKLEKKVG